MYSHFLLKDYTLNLSANYINFNLILNNKYYRKQLIDVFSINLDLIRVHMLDQNHEVLIRHIRKSDHLLLLLLEIMRKHDLKVHGSRRQNDLMRIDQVSLHIQSDITQLFLVQHPNEVLLVIRI